MGVAGVGYEVERDVGHKLEIHSGHKDKEGWI